MYRFVCAAALTMLVGCGLSSTKFNDQSLQVTCQWLVDCFQMYATVDACKSSPTMAQPDTTNCTYDAKAAKTCLDGLNALDCNSTQSDIPAECSTVYTNCGGTGM